MESISSNAMTMLLKGNWAMYNKKSLIKNLNHLQKKEYCDYWCFNPVSHWILIRLEKAQLNQFFIYTKAHRKGKWNQNQIAFSRWVWYSISNMVFASLHEIRNWTIKNLVYASTNPQKYEKHKLIIANICIYHRGWRFKANCFTSVDFLAIITANIVQCPLRCAIEVPWFPEKGVARQNQKFKQ